MNFSQLHHERNSSAPLRCKSVAYDVNQQAGSLVRWEQHYNQHSQGVFNGYLDELQLGGLHLFEEFTNQKLLQQCCVNEGSVWLGFSLQSQRPRINGYEIGPDQLMLRPSNVEFELLTPEDFHIFGIVLDKEAITAQLQADERADWLGVAERLLVSRPDHSLHVELARTIPLLLSEQSPLLNGLDKQAQRARVQRLQPLIISHIADLLVRIGPAVEGRNLMPSRQRRVIERIRHYIDATGCYPLTMTELCNIACVSRRTLQYCFEHELDISPMHYLRDCRLNEIRRYLIANSHVEPIVVADLAMAFGFYHTSTFNEHYKLLFGETPTQTMRRAGAYHEPVL